jgi:hypothetical protein
MQEGGLDNPLNMPAVRPPLFGVAVKMTEAIQRMSYDLMRHFNDSITPNKWTAVHGDTTAFNNGTGCDIYRNYITGERMGAELPRYEKAGRHCAGAFIRGVVEGSELVCYPGVHAIDANKTLPPLQTIIDNVWYFTAVTSSATQANHFPQCGGLPVMIPFILRDPTRFPLWWFARWDNDRLPNPLRFGG